jgi:uncharacterized membrane protein
MARGETPGEFLNPAEREQVAAAIQAAEARTSGEIRVCLESRLPLLTPDPYRHARRVFARMGMHATAERNGVLVYLALRSHRYAIVGDEALHRHVGDEFWRATAAAMGTHFAADRFGDGLAEAIGRIGERLAERFPRRDDDVNELSDEIQFGK